jgi:hypothetical protein
VVTNGKGNVMGLERVAPINTRPTGVRIPGASSRLAALLVNPSTGPATSPVAGQGGQIRSGSLDESGPNTHTPTFLQTARDPSFQNAIQCVATFPAAARTLFLTKLDWAMTKPIDPSPNEFEARGGRARLTSAKKSIGGNHGAVMDGGKKSVGQIVFSDRCKSEGANTCPHGTQRRFQVHFQSCYD